MERKAVLGAIPAMSMIEIGFYFVCLLFALIAGIIGDCVWGVWILPAIAGFFGDCSNNTDIF
jgi:hypothetical protein